MHLVGIAQAGGGDALVAGGEHQNALTPKQYDAGEAHHFFGEHGVANDGERFLAHTVSRR